MKSSIATKIQRNPRIVPQHVGSQGSFASCDRACDVAKQRTTDQAGYQGSVPAAQVAAPINS